MWIGPTDPCLWIAGRVRISISIARIAITRLGLRDTPPARYELVFIDPPFKQELWQETLQRLQAGWLAEHASIYIETDQELSEFNLPAGLEWTKQARIGNVSLGLACEQAER